MIFISINLDTKYNLIQILDYGNLLHLMHNSNKTLSMNIKHYFASIIIVLLVSLPLCSQVIPALTCESSSVYYIDELDSLTGTMLDFSNPTGATPLCPSGGGAHNTSWMAFYSWGGTYHFQIEFDKCTVNGTGVQFGVWGGCDFTESVFCDPSCTGPGKKEFDATLKAGKIYYLFFDGCTGDVCDYIFHVGKPINTISFRNFIDMNSNCTYDQSEQLSDILTLGHSHDGKVDYYPFSNLHIPLYNFQKGLHKFWIKENSKNWQTCVDTIIYNLDSISQDTTIDIGIYNTRDCPEVMIEISSARLLFCAQNTYQVSYKNLSLTELQNSTIQLEIPVSLSVISSTLPIQSSNPPFYTFAISNLGPLSSSNFTVTVQSPCDPILLGSTFCASAKFLLDTICDQDSLWDGSSLNVRAVCDTTAKMVRFIITNPTKFDMTRESGYAIIEDEIMPLLKGTVKLKMENSKVLDYPARGSTYRIILDQVQHHPGNSHPTIALEGCGVDQNGEFSHGKVLQFPEDEQDQNVSIDCKELRGSYDPNDKSATPTGFANNHFIENNTPVEYLIRFQNEGNDVAERVVIHDKLDNSFDISSFEIIGSSHPVTYGIHDQYIEFIFDNINLTYKSNNDLDSRGYVNYRLHLKPDLTVGTRIENEADIFFDHNPPIRTNQTYHTIWEKIITQIYSSDETLHALIYPNPTNGRINIELPNERNNFTLEIVDVNGRTLHRQKLNERKTQLNIDPFIRETGIYLIKLADDHGFFSLYKILYIR